MKQQINLYLPEFRKRKDPLGFTAMLAVLGGVVALLAVATAGQYWGAASLEGSLDARQAELAQAAEQGSRLAATLGARTRDDTLAASVQRLEDGLRDKRILLGFLEGRELGNTIGFSSHLADLARFLVPGLRLTRVTLGAGGDSVRLGGEVTRPENVPLYLQNLSRGHSYGGRNFQTLRIGDTQQSGLLNFEVASSDGGR